ncbi:hypothetical protein A4S06_07880 [Erysipelotrichaceae bacterium MTC7]|nr:hypothetical protein A4S06_07880 [Erysipelotrichaceae bacterium MTC7]
MKILLTTHGGFANGILESYKMIAGSTEDIEAISLDDDGITVYQERLYAWLDAHQKEDVLILSDLKGGTPFNECYAYYLSHSTHIRLLAGLNLPMLLETGLQLPAALTLDQYASIAYETGKQEVYMAIDEDEDSLEL